MKKNMQFLAKMKSYQQNEKLRKPNSAKNEAIKILARINVKNISSMERGYPNL